MFNNSIKDSELYKEVKAITNEMLSGLSDKIAYLVCTYKAVAKEQTQTKNIAENSFLARIEYEQKETLKDFCKKNKIGCDWFAQRTSWKVFSDNEQLLNKARDFVLTELKGKVF